MRARSIGRPMSAYRLPRIDTLAPSSLLGPPPGLDVLSPVCPPQDGDRFSDDSGNDSVKGANDGEENRSNAETGANKIVEDSSAGVDLPAGVRSPATQSSESDDGEEGGGDPHHPAAKESSAPKKRWHHSKGGGGVCNSVEVSPDHDDGVHADGPPMPSGEDENTDDRRPAAAVDAGSAGEGGAVRRVSSNEDVEQRMTDDADREADPKAAMDAAAAEPEIAMQYEDEGSMVDEDEQDEDDDEEEETESEDYGDDEKEFVHVEPSSDAAASSKSRGGEEEEEGGSSSDTNNKASSAARGEGSKEAVVDKSRRTKIHIKIPARAAGVENPRRAEEDEGNIQDHLKNVNAEANQEKEGKEPEDSGDGASDVVKLRPFSSPAPTGDEHEAGAAAAVTPAGKAAPAATYNPVRAPHQHPDAIVRHPLEAEPLHINAIRDTTGPTSEDVGLTMSQTVGMGTASTTPSLGPGQAATLAAINAVRDGLNRASLHLNLNAGNMSIGLDDPDVCDSAGGGLLISVKLGVPASSDKDNKGGEGGDHPIRPANVDFDALAASIPRSLRVVSPIEMDVGGLVVDLPDHDRSFDEDVDEDVRRVSASTFVVLASLTISRPRLSKLPSSDSAPREAPRDRGSILRELDRRDRETRRSMRMQGMIDALIRQNDLLGRERSLLMREAEELRLRLLAASGVRLAALPPGARPLAGLSPAGLTAIPPPVLDPSAATTAAEAASRIQAAGIQGVQVVGTSPELLGGSKGPTAPGQAAAIAAASAPAAAEDAAPIAAALATASGKTTPLGADGRTAATETPVVPPRSPEETNRMLRELVTAETALWNRMPKEVRRESPAVEEEEEENRSSDKKRKRGDLAGGTPLLPAAIDNDADFSGVETLARLSAKFLKAKEEDKADSTTVQKKRPSQPRPMEQRPSQPFIVSSKTRTEEADSTVQHTKKSRKAGSKVTENKGFKRIKNKHKPATDRGNDRLYISHEYRDHSLARPTVDGYIELPADPTDASTKGKKLKGRKIPALPLCRGGKFLSLNEGAVHAQALGQLTFPLKLHGLLAEVEANGESDIIGWQPHGRCFIVRQQKEFIEKIMPRYFQLTKYCSFLRQLNLYGFRRFSVGLDKGAYYHELFLRGMPWLAKAMVRIRVNGNGIRCAGNPDMEPDFYSMPPVPSHPQDTETLDEFKRIQKIQQDTRQRERMKDCP